jgi:hypothetical protein
MVLAKVYDLGDPIITCSYEDKDKPKMPSYGGELELEDGLFIKVGKVLYDKYNVIVYEVLDAWEVDEDDDEDE